MWYNKYVIKRKEVNTMTYEELNRGEIEYDEEYGKKANPKQIVEHIHCPVDGYDCPYYTDENHPCRCTLADPLKDCDDFGVFWDEGDDYIDNDWVVE